MSELLPQLPQSISSQIDGLTMKAGEYREKSEGAKFAATLQDIWDLLPEPKTNWDYYPQVVTTAAVDLLPQLKQCDALNIWIDRFYAAYMDQDRQSEYTNLSVGHSLMQCNRQDEAIVLFKHVLAHHGPQWFSGEYRPYLDLAEN